MSVKKEAERRSVELTLEVPGTPEEVWRAIATGPGTTAWFVPTEIEERAGGTLLFHLLPGLDSAGRVTAWQPPERFAYEEPAWSEGAPPLATEILVEARSGGTCVVRMVHSLFTSSDAWDDQLESMENGWPPFFEVLRIYLAHHRDQHCTPVQLMRVPKASPDHAWGVLEAALQLSASLGERITSAAPRLAGQPVWRQDRPKQRCAVVHLEAPGPGALVVSCFEMGGETYATLGIYLYGARRDDGRHIEAAQRVEAEWRPWFEGLIFDAPSVS
jgi:uncharacterized protein YndB with AHSA1/START domain